MNITLESQGRAEDNGSPLSHDVVPAVEPATPLTPEVPAAPEQTAVEPQRSPLVTGNARPLPYLDAYGNGIEESRPIDWGAIANPRKTDPYTERFNVPGYDLDANFRPAEPHEIEAYKDWKKKRVDYGTAIVIEEIFRDRQDAWEQTPDKAAHNLWLESKTGIPRTMLDDPEMQSFAEKKAAIGLDMLSLANAPRRVIDWFQTPGALELARDDIETLTKIGKAMNALAVMRAPEKVSEGLVESAVNGIWRDQIGAERTKVALEMMQNGHSPAALARLEALNKQLQTIGEPLEKQWWHPFVSGGASLASQISRHWWRAATEDRNTTMGLITGGSILGAKASLLGPQALIPGAQLIGAAAGGMAGVSAAMTAASSKNTFEGYTGNAYLEYLESGMEPEVARGAAVVAGVLTAGVDYLTFKRLMKYIPGLDKFFSPKQVAQQIFGSSAGRKALVEIGKQALYDIHKNGIGNALQEVAVITMGELGKAYSGIESDVTFASAASRTWGAYMDMVYGSPLVMLPGFALNSIRGYQSAIQASQQANQDANFATRAGQMMDNAMKYAASSKTLERSPEMFDDFVKYVSDGAADTVFVGADTFYQTLGENAQTVAEQLGVADQLAEAAETGGDIAISTAAIMQNPEVYQQVKDDIRYTEDGMSRNEAAEFQRTRDSEQQKQTRDVADALRTLEQAGESALRVKEDIRMQLEALGHKAIGKQQAEMYSTLYTAMAANEARIMGISPEEWVQRFNVRVAYDKNADHISIARDGKAAQFTQPLNAGVNLNDKVKIVDIELGQYIDAQLSTPKDLLTHIKGFIGKEAMLSADSKALLEVSSNSNAKHLVRSSKKGQSYNEIDARNAALRSIEDIVKNAVLIESFPNQDSSKTHLKNVHRLYVPLRIGDDLYTLRVVAHETSNKSGLVPIRADLFDLFTEDKNSTSESLTGSPLSRALPEPTQGGALESTSLPGVSDTGSILADAPPGPVESGAEISIREMLAGVKDASGENYAQSSAQEAVSLPQTPEETRQLVNRMKELPTEMWTAEDLRQFEAYLDKVFDETDPTTWGLSPSEAEQYQHLIWDDTDPDTWPDQNKADTFKALQEEDPDSPKIARIDEEIDREFNESTETLREIGFALYDRLQRKLESAGISFIGEMEHPANQNIEAVLALLQEAEKTPSEQWTQELHERMQDFMDNAGDLSYWGTDIQDMVETNGLRIDPQFPDTWLENETTADLGYDAIDLEKRILLETDKAEKKGMRSELAAIKKEVKPLAKELAKEYDAREDADAKRIDALREKLESAFGEKYYQSAHHGSRNDFNAIDLSFVGQGADTNANPDEGGHFGWGFYSTQEKGHAEMYRKSVTEGESTGQLYKVDVPESNTILDWDASLAGQPAQVRKALESDQLTRGIMDRAEATTEEIAALPADYQLPETTAKEVKTHFGDWIEVDITEEAREKLAGTLLPSIAINESKTEPGKYEINLGDGEIMVRDSAKELVSYAKDRLQQEYAEKLLAVIRENNLSENYDSDSGGWLYRELEQELGSARAASEHLAGLGIPGLQHENAKGTKDFVTWNERAISILETYYQEQNAKGPKGSISLGEIETVVTIFKAGDRSTFLHEMGHLFLESRRRLSQMDGIADVIRQDWGKTLEWLEVADIDFSQPLSLADTQRWKTAQEKWAAGFETYLTEGKAPTPALQRAFRAFAKWLTDIYRAAKNILYTDADGQQHTLEMTDEIRGVMDRMLASEEEIEAAKAVQDATRLKQKLLERGIPDTTAQKYQDLIDAGKDKARAKLFKKLMAELRGEKQEALKAARIEAKKTAASEVWELPEYKAFKMLRRSLEKGGIRLSMLDLVDVYGDAEAQKLIKVLPFGVVANDGISLEMAAELLGYPTGAALLEDLKKAQAMPPARAISERVRAATAELESVVNNPEALKSEVEEALHSPERLEWIAMEQALLEDEAKRVADQIGKEEARGEKEQARKEKTERTEQARKEAKRDSKQWGEEMAARAESYEAIARKVLAGKNISEAIATAKYLTAERRAADKSYKEALAGNVEDAAYWKSTEMLNHALAMESMKIKEEFERGEALLKKYWPNRKRLRGVIGETYFAQIMGILERTGYQREDPQSKGRPRLQEFVKKLEAERQSAVPIAQWIQDLDIRDAHLAPTRMTFGEFADVAEAVKIVDHIGRQQNKLLASERLADFGAAVGALTGAIQKEYGVPGAPSQSTDGKPRTIMGQYFGSLDRVETIIRLADNLKDQGTVWETLYKPVQDASNKKIIMAEKAKAEYQGLLDRLQEKMGGKKTFQKFLNTKLDTGLIDTGTGTKLYWTGENLLAAQLNWGNEANRERLVFGWGLHGLGMTAHFADDAQYQNAFATGQYITERIFERLGTSETWQFTQGVWDMIDGYWPQIEQLERAMTGAAPEKIEATPVRTAQGKTLSGGYYPVMFDTGRDWMGFKHEEMEQMNALNKAQGFRAATRHRHTKERVERLVGHPIRLDLGVIQQHLNDVIHDLTHRPVIRDLNKLTTNDEVRAMLTHAVGRNAYEQFSGWIKDLANQTKPKGAASVVLGKAIGRASAVQLGLKLIMVLGNFSSLTVAAWRLGPVASVKGLVGFYLSPWNWGTGGKFALESSPELRNRINGTDANIREAYEQARNNTTDSLRSQGEQAFYWALGYSERLISIPIWSAAYDQGLNKFNNDHQKAVDHADWVIRSTQNTSAVKDLAAIQRDGVLGKLMTIYYSQMGSKYNLFREEMHRLKKGANLPSAVRMAGFMLTVFMLETLLNDLFKGRAPDEPEKEVVAKWALEATLGNFASMYPLFGAAVNAGIAFGGQNYRPSPAFGGFEAAARMTGNIAKDVKNLWNGDVDKLNLWRDTKSVAETAGYVYGIPTQQLFQWGDTFMRWMQDEPDFNLSEFVWPVKRKK